MGGMTAQALAARHPQLLKSITIANAAMHYDDAARAMWAARVKTVLEQGVAAIADGAMQRWFTPEFRADEAGGGKQRVARIAPAAGEDRCGRLCRQLRSGCRHRLSRRATAASNARPW
jgi:pimeloyl-ACP methyl ester carboxylesterase